MPPAEALSMNRRTTETSPFAGNERRGDAIGGALPEKGSNQSPYSGIGPGRTQHMPCLLTYKKTAENSTLGKEAALPNQRQLTALVRSKQRHREARSEEHTSELQSLMRNSYAVFCLKKNK